MHDYKGKERKNVAKYLHTNFNVRNLEASLAFYEKALGLKEIRQVEGPESAFTIVFRGDGCFDAFFRAYLSAGSSPDL